VLPVHVDVVELVLAGLSDLGLADRTGSGPFLSPLNF
jgi:hypothetical protein